jgi:transcriptional regulator with XRE-family HTH domain
VDVAFIIKRRLKELGLEQRDLAAAADVTESYISQLLARKKTPPAPARTDLYDRIGTFLRLPGRELSRLAELERNEALKRRLADPPEPLFKAFRALILGKCASGKRPQMREIFEREPFGPLERLVTQKLLDVAKGVVTEALAGEEWVQRVARLSGQGYEQMRVTILEFLDTDVFHVSAENCVSILDPLLETWSIDLETFAVDVVLNRDLARTHVRRFAYVERQPEQPLETEAGLEEFLQDPLLSGDATEAEIEFLRGLRFEDRRPLPLYYYRVLQATRDRLHFRVEPQARS